ncbi:MAG: phage virion morphogenesis protein [Desulfovibrionaceae bacterium]|nr:phage virion morphogenesis protein [Desulfovibrionaceae bacterium]
MPSFSIQVQDEEVQSLLKRLAEKLGDLQPALQAIGDDMVERTKARFDISPVGQAPDGTPWKANAPSTLAAWLGSGYRKKSGDLNAAGLRRLATKRPLIGKSGDLRRQIVARASSNELVVGASPVYAAIHQFGGQAGRGRKVTIPARPFLPIRLDGTLCPQERTKIIDAIKDMLLG